MSTTQTSQFRGSAGNHHEEKQEEGADHKIGEACDELSRRVRQQSVEGMLEANQQSGGKDGGDREQVGLPSRRTRAPFLPDLPPASDHEERATEKQQCPHDPDSIDRHDIDPCQPQAIDCQRAQKLSRDRGCDYGPGADTGNRESGSRDVGGPDKTSGQLVDRNAPQGGKFACLPTHQNQQQQNHGADNKADKGRRKFADVLSEGTVDRWLEGQLGPHHYDQQAGQAAAHSI